MHWNKEGNGFLVFRKMNFYVLVQWKILISLFYNFLTRTKPLIKLIFCICAGILQELTGILQEVTGILQEYAGIL